MKGALLYNDWIEKNKMQKKYAKIQIGDKIKFLYLKLPNIIRNSVISFPNDLP